VARLKVYQYSRCATCRKAVKHLRQQGHELELVEIIDHPPTEEELRAFIRSSGLEAAKFFNTSGEVYKQMKLKDTAKSMSEEEIVRLLASNGKLIKRPIVTDGRRASVGYHEETFNRIWS
jgi:arsenate reductase